MTFKEKLKRLCSLWFYLKPEIDEMIPSNTVEVTITYLDESTDTVNLLIENSE